MRKIILFAMFLGSGCATTSRDPASYDPTTALYEDPITSARVLAEDLDVFHKSMREATMTFVRDVAPLKNKIKTTIDGSDCMSVGYDFTDREMHFCSPKKYIKMGLQSVDIIHHEAFHAMLCDLRPDTCTEDVKDDDKDTLAIHEGLADFFANSFSPDGCFGEDFLQDSSCLRSYHTDLCYSLNKGSHRKGNILASKLIENGVTVGQLREFFINGEFTVSELLKASGIPAAGCFDSQNAPKLSVVPKNYPYSKVNKYRLYKDKPLELTFEPNSALTSMYKKINIAWTGQRSDTPFKVERKGPYSFKITGTQDRGTAIFTIVVTGDGQPLTDFRMYFGMKFE